MVPPPQRKVGELRFVGTGVSPGIAIGPVFGAREPAAVVARHRIQAADIEAELARLEGGIRQSLKQLGKLKMKLAVLPDEARSEIEPLIAAYTYMLGPTRLTQGMRQRIRETLVSAEAAVIGECEASAALLAQAQSADDNEDDRASHERRAEEVREIGRRLVRNLTRTAFRSFADLPSGAIVMCESLRPADAALLDPSRVGGVATDEGAGAGHTAIMLRSLGLPTVLGATGLSQRMSPGDLAVIDGAAGVVVLNPSAETLALARQAQVDFVQARQMLTSLRRKRSETLDGRLIELLANIELPAELASVGQAGAQGIGLLRTEFLFMNRETLPDEAAQEAIYREVAAAANGGVVTVRVLDWGGEKEIDALSNAGLVPELNDTNPALGLRGIRLLLRQPTLLETQLTAIVRAATAGALRILVPMVTSVEEVRQARRIYEKVVRRLRREGARLPQELPPFGVMIETPGAALAADGLAAVADFFAIGTNDLTMYTLAVDRAESSVSGLYDPLHPAVLRLMQFAIESAGRFGRPVSICGEIAGDPAFTALLLGLGVTQLSMNTVNLPWVKQRIRGLTMSACRSLAEEVMREADPERIREVMNRFDKGDKARGAAP